MNRSPILSVLIPAYNEEKTIEELLAKVSAVALPEEVCLEMIIVNDHSTDRTEEKILNFQQAHPDIRLKYLKHEHNQGKGAAIRTAIGVVEGDIVIIQDADLEYEPQDYALMLPYILSGEEKVIYGSRFLNKKNRHSYQSFYWGGRLVSLCANLLFFQHLTDEPTCYKMFDATVLKSIPLRCTGFEFCAEVTAKIARRGYRIKEVPIHYYPRSIQEGKKIKWYDGIEAIWTLVRYRFTS